MSVRVVRTVELETGAGKILATATEGVVCIERTWLRDTRETVHLDITQLRELTDAIDPRPEPLVTLIDAQQVAAALNISASTLQALAVAGEAPPFIAFGNRRRWRSEDVNAWISEQLGEASA